MRRKEVSHTLLLAVIEPLASMAYKQRLISELVSNVVKKHHIISNNILESKLSIVHRNDTVANVKSVFSVWNSVKENVKMTLSEVHNLVKTVPTTPVPTVKSQRCCNTLKGIKSYLRISLKQGSLIGLAVLSIYKDIFADTLRFNQKVSELFTPQNKIEMCSFFTDNAIFNDFVIPHNFHELS